MSIFRRGKKSDVTDDAVDQGDRDVIAGVDGEVDGSDEVVDGNGGAEVASPAEAQDPTTHDAVVDLVAAVDLAVDPCADVAVALVHRVVRDV